MVDVILYTFSKKENSTAQPTGGTTISGVFREPSSIVNPTIMFKLNSAPTFNHAYIAEFNRYYFIENWTTDHGLWIASMRVDALASWKSNIGSSTQYVTRSASRFDGTIIDMLYPTTSEVTAHFSQLPESPIDLTGSMFVLGIAGTEGIIYYGMGAEQYKQFTNALFSSTEWLGDIKEIGEDLMKALADPMQYILSCRWFPLNVGDIDGTIYHDNITFGFWTLPLDCYELPRYVSEIYATIPFTQHPQSATRGTYLNARPFTTRTFYCQAFGVIPLNTNTLTEETQVPVALDIDLYTGKAKLEFFAGTRQDKQPFQAEFCQLAVEIELLQKDNNVGSIATTGAGIVGGIASALMGNIPLALGSAVGIASSIDNLMPQTKTQGAIGSTIAFTRAPYLYTEFLKVVDDAPTHRGKPLCKDVVLSTLSGYITVSDPDIAFPCTAEEEREIAHYMESGFYYE